MFLRNCTLLSFLLSLVVIQARAQSAPASASESSSSHPQGSSSEVSKQSREEWSTIELAKSGLNLQAIGGLPISKVDVPGGCTRELLRMQWRLTDPIDLYITRPRNAQKLPVVLFLYNYNVDTDVFRQDRWCEKAMQNGFAVVGFPSALSWQRLHTPRPMKEWFVSELQEALATSTHDVQMILNYLATRDDLDVHRVGIFGQGSGGAIAVLAAAADSRITALDLMDPWGDWPDWLRGSRQIPEDERPDYLKPEFLQHVAGLDPVIYLPQLKGKAIRIQQTDNDLVTPVAARLKIAAAVPNPDAASRYPDLQAEAKALGPNGILSWLGAQIDSKQSESAQSEPASSNNKPNR